MVWIASERLGSSEILLWAYHRSEGRERRAGSGSRKLDQRGKNRDSACAEDKEGVRSKDLCPGQGAPAGQKIPGAGNSGASL